MCKNCNKIPVYITQSGTKFCKNCFLHYIEKKVFKTIRIYKLIQKKDNLVIGISGGKDSITCLHILNKILKQRRQKVIAIFIDENIKNYSDKNLKFTKDFCKKENVQLKIYTYKDEFKNSIKELIKKHKNPCTICGVARRYLLNKKSRELNANKLVTGHNLDDEAQSILMNQFKGNIEFSAKLGPKTGMLMHSKFIPRIKPLYFITEQEVKLYAKLKKFKISSLKCPYRSISFRAQVRDLLDKLESKYPGTKQSIVKSFLEILPLIRQKYQKEQIKTCKICNEPANKEICRFCELMK
jgi:uncharacterized protein (TIGR00269 family)